MLKISLYRWKFSWVRMVGRRWINSHGSGKKMLEVGWFLFTKINHQPPPPQTATRFLKGRNLLAGIERSVKDLEITRRLSNSWWIAMSWLLRENYWAVLFLKLILYVIFYLRNLKEAVIGSRTTGCNSLMVWMFIMARYPTMFLELLKKSRISFFVLISKTCINVLRGLRQSGIVLT
jgi:hypothetical protein